MQNRSSTFKKNDPPSNHQNISTDSTYTTNIQVQTIQSADNYKIEKKENQYYYSIYDKYKNVVFSGGPVSKQPDITLIDDNIIKLVSQSGTGLATQSCIYFDVVNLLSSEVYSGVLDECDGLVAYAKYDKVIICDIFNCEKYCREITKFNHPFSPVAFPFLSAEFRDGGSAIKITYLAGDGYDKTEETIKLS